MLFLQVNSSGLRGRSLLCDLLLSVPSSEYAFHSFVEEMHFLGEEEEEDGCEVDYIKYGTDSHKLCGVREGLSPTTRGHLHR